MTRQHEHEQTAGTNSRQALVRLRAAIRRVVVLEALTAGIGLVIVAVLAEGLVDYLLRLPVWLRVFFLALGTALVLVGISKKLLPALRLRPKLSTLALRVERTEIGRSSNLRGVLASGVELARQSPDTDEPDSINWLRNTAATNADSQSQRVSLNKLLYTGTLKHNMFGLLLAIVAVGTISFAAPTTAKTSAMRTLLPWSNASWPKRTELADITRTQPHALGSALPLRAIVTRTNRSVGDTPVEVVYRITTAAGTTDFRAEPMTGQELFETSANGSTGEAYERLIEPSITLADSSIPATLEFFFRTPDDRTPIQQIMLVEPPRVVSLTATIVPPAYAPANTDVSTWLTGSHDLGDGQDERAVLGPVLVGSTITVTANLNKPASIGGSPLEIIGEQPSNLDITQQDTTSTLTWTAQDRGRLRLSLTDDLGIASVDDAFVRLETLQDREPSVTVTVPERDEAVLATAIVDLVGEARDDVGLSWIALSMQQAKIPESAKGSPGALPETFGDPVQLIRVETNQLRAEANWTLQLDSLELEVGDELRITAIATDVYALTDASGLAQTHGETASAIRTLRIISDTELVEQILAELGGIRRSAVRLDEQQSQLIAQLRQAQEEGDQPAQSLARDQASLTDALDRLDNTVSQLRDRSERNGLDDSSLDDLLSKAEQTIDRAGDDSEQAAAELNTASQEQSTESETKAEEAQQRVRRAMEDLALLLDRGEDSWAIRQAITGLVEDQSELAEQTTELGKRTVGKTGSQLSSEEQTELDRIAQRQLELAKRSSDLLDELDDRSADMQETDPGQASAMRSAARRGREQGVPQSLQQAAESVQSNNTSDAGRQQKDALEQLEQMLEDLEEAEKQRDAELKRALLSLIESIEALVRTQQNELALLLNTLHNTGDIRTLATGMASLHRNTLSVAGEAGTNPDTARISDLLGEAAGAQTNGIIALGDSESQLATRHEELSLTRLESALEAAQEELDNAEERELERKKEELKAAYTDALVLQEAISEQTKPLVKDHLSRRDRADARNIGRSEQELRATLADIPAAYEEITAAGVFELVHRRIDSQLNDIGTSFVAGNVSRKHARQQSSVESLLRGLIESLEDPKSDEPSFSEGSGESSGSSSGGQEEQLIPPLAELRLLRTMQQDLLDQTRMIEDFGSTPQEAAAMGELQSEVAEQGEILIEKLKQQDGQQQPPAPSGGAQ